MSGSPLFNRIFEQDELFRSVDVGSVLRDRGIEAALEKAQRLKSDYIERCLSAIKEFPKGARITSESVRDVAGDVPEGISPNCMAGILKKAAAQGLIVITKERVNGKRPSLHAAEIRVWVRL